MTFTLPTLFLAGLLTFLSPCVLPLVPLYLAMLGGTSAVALREGKGGARLVASALAFAVGLTVVFVLLGMGASTVGRTLSEHRTLLLQLAGLAIFLAGLKFLGFLQVPWLDREARPYLASLQRKSGVLWPFLFGAAFALGWSPCVGPALGSVLAFAATSGSAPLSALYLATYALGLTLPMVLISFAAPWALRILDRAKKRIRIFEITSGVFLAILGLLFMTGHASAFVNSGPIVPSDKIPSSIDADLPPPAMPIMLEFVSAGCPVCQRMKPVVAAAKQDCSRHGVEFKTVDVSTSAGRGTAARFGVLGVPTFLFLDPAGKEIARLVGQQPPQTLIQSLEVLSGQTCEGFRRLKTRSLRNSQVPDANSASNPTSPAACLPGFQANPRVSAGCAVL